MTHMRLRAFAVIAATVAFTLTACGGEDGNATPSAGGQNAIPTATPFATLPAPTVVSGPGTTSAPVDEVTYVVEAGDAISTIAARFGVPEEVIREANGIEENEIFIGQVLRIPRTTGGIPSATATPSVSTGGPGEYVVQPGDTAFGIALQFDITVEALEEANGVGPGGLDALSLGQVLRIPTP
ncbi:MAG: hypothetical protein AMXMBFR23_08380 [Chloroflexota bacterium]